MNQGSTVILATEAQRDGRDCLCEQSFQHLLQFYSKKNNIKLELEVLINFKVYKVI